MKLAPVPNVRATTLARNNAYTRKAATLVATAAPLYYLPPPNSGKVPKGTVLRGRGEYDRRAGTLNHAAYVWLKGQPKLARPKKSTARRVDNLPPSTARTIRRRRGNVTMPTGVFSSRPAR